VSWRALPAVAGLVLLASCAKIFGVDDPGTLSDGGVGEPCDMNSNNQTQCGQGLVCLSSNANGTGNVCARTCTADGECAPGQGCLAVNQPNGGGNGAFVYACQPNTSCNNGACGSNGTSCSNGVCRDTCTLGNGGGPGMGTCPSDETCVPSCPTCSSGVCSPNDGGTSGGEGGADGGSSFAPLPQPLTEMACVAGMDGKIYVFGGMDMSQAPTQTTYIYDPVANQWSNGTPMSFRVYGAGVGVSLTNPPGFYVVGGFGPSGAAAGGNEMYNPGGAPGGSWMQASPMPTALGGSAVGGIGMFIVAGGATTVSGPPVTTVESFQSNGQWSSTPPAMLGIARKWMAASLSTGGAMLTIGGFDSTGHVTQIVEQLEGANWGLVAALPTGRAKLAATTGPNSLVYAVGGFDGARVLGTVEAYDPSGNQWQTLASMPTPREGLCLVWMMGMGQGRLYAIGGDDGASPMPDPLSTVEAFDIGSNTWIR